MSYCSELLEFTFPETEDFKIQHDMFFHLVDTMSEVMEYNFVAKEGSRLNFNFPFFKRKLSKLPEEMKMLILVDQDLQIGNDARRCITYQLNIVPDSSMLEISPAQKEKIGVSLANFEVSKRIKDI